MKHLNYAVGAGWVALIALIPMIIFNVIRVVDSGSPLISSWLLWLYVIVIVSVVMFTLGFEPISIKQKNFFLLRSIYAFILMVTVFYMNSIITLFTPEKYWLSQLILVVFGISTIFLGLGFKKLKHFGPLPVWAGWLQMIMGVGILTTILALPAALLALPVTIICLMILTKAAK